MLLFWKERFYDLRAGFHLQSDIKDKSLVLVAVDDDSIEKIGSWPIPRKNWANLIDKLNHFGANIIAFDILFSEESLSCGEIKPEKFMLDAMTQFQSTSGRKIVLPYGMASDFRAALKDIPDSLYNSMVDIQQRKGLNLKSFFCR